MEFLQSLWEAFSLYRHIIVPVIVVLTLTLVVIRWWEQVSYFFLNLMCSLPVVGHIARLSRANDPRRNGTGNGLWYPAEEALCAKYWQYYRTSNHTADFYLRCVDYLSKADERGRKPTSLLLWFCTGGLVMLEAFIFALVLSPFIANNISANQAELSAAVVSILIGIILVPSTHRMGKELHHNSLLRKINYWHDEARHNQSARDLKNSNDISLETTHKDDDQPAYLQMLNRVPHNAQVKPQYWATGIAVALILFFAVGAYFVRAATIDTQDTQAVNGSPFSQQVNAAASPFDLPAEAAADNAAADQKAGEEIASNRVFASKLTFIILSVIFVGVQLIGILIGLYYSLVGTDSKAAARYIGDFSSSQEFADFHAMRRERVARNAQDKLATLQNRLLRKRRLSQSEELPRLPTFQDYVEGKQREADQWEANERTRTLSKLAADQEMEAAKVRQQHGQAAPAPAAVVSAAATVVTPAPAVAVAQAAPAQPESVPSAQTLTAAGYAPATAATSAGYAPVPTAATESDAALKQQISELGDLTVLTQEELEVMAEGMNLPLAALLRHQKLQQVMNKARGVTA